MLVVPSFFFFFQAEDGIRDLTVTGVQTCALPILVLPRYRPSQSSFRAQSPPAGAFRHSIPPTAEVQPQNKPEPNHASQETPHQQRQKRPSQAYKSPYHGDHFHIAHAHAFVAAHQFVSCRQSPQQKAPERSSENSVQNPRRESRQSYLQES